MPKGQISQKGAGGKATGSNNPKKTRKRVQAVETTIHMRRYIRNQIGNHRRTPRSVKVIRRHARKLFNVSMVKIDNSLNKALWANGIKRPPSRIRIKYQLKRLKGKGGQPCVYASHIPVQSFHNLRTKRVTTGGGGGGGGGAQADPVSPRLSSSTSNTSSGGGSKKSSAGKNLTVSSVSRKSASQPNTPKDLLPKKEGSLDLKKPSGSSQGMPPKKASSAVPRRTSLTVGKTAKK